MRSLTCGLIYGILTAAAGAAAWGGERAGSSAGLSSRGKGGGAFASAAIVHGQQADPLERLAAKELQRYLYRISGALLPVGGPQAWDEKPGEPLILVGTPAGNPLVHRLAEAGRVAAGEDVLGDQGFSVRAIDEQGRRLVVVTAATPVGVLYGSYSLPELPVRGAGQGRGRQCGTGAGGVDRGPAVSAASGAAGGQGHGWPG
jgi:hypothetical protein